MYNTVHVLSMSLQLPEWKCMLVARMGAKRNTYRLWVGKPEGKRPLGRPRHRWVDNIRMDLGEVGWGDVDWIGLAQERNSSCEFGIEPSGSIKCWETIEWPNNWRPLEYCSAPWSWVIFIMFPYISKIAYSFIYTFCVFNLNFVSCSSYFLNREEHLISFV
jgi:hypothetical protein